LLTAPVQSEWPHLPLAAMCSVRGRGGAREDDALGHSEVFEAGVGQPVGKDKKQAATQKQVSSQ